MIRLPLIVLLSSLTVLSSAPVRAACTDGPEVCVDGPGSKFINGVEVWRECWNYQPRVTALQARLSIIVPA